MVVVVVVNWGRGKNEGVPVQVQIKIKIYMCRLFTLVAYLYLIFVCNVYIVHVCMYVCM